MGAGIYVARTFLNPILSSLVDPEKEKQEQARQHAKAHLERLNRRQRQEDGDDDMSISRSGRVEELQLNEYENLIALEMVAPEDIPVGFDGELPLRIRIASGVRSLTVIPNRYRRPGYHHRGNQRGHYIPPHNASHLLSRRLVVISTFWSLIVRTAWMRQDDACEGGGA